MDILVSSYYFHQMAAFLEDPGTFDEFMDKFLEGRGQTLVREVFSILMYYSLKQAVY